MPGLWRPAAAGGGRRGGGRGRALPATREQRFLKNKNMPKYGYESAKLEITHQET